MEFPMGAKVTFLDASATVSDGSSGVSTGVVNGPVFEGRVFNDAGRFVPVFAARDNGRESTTVLVAESNVLKVEPNR